MTCNNCGASLESTATTCPVCGTAVGAAAAGPTGPAGDERPAWETGTPGAGGPGAGGPGAGGPGAGGPGAGGYGPGAAGTWQGQPYGTPAWQTPITHPSGLSSEVRGWGAGAHWSAFLAFIGLPIVGPLLVWLVKRDHPFVDHHGKEALNFQLSVALYAIVLGLASFPIGLLTFGIGFIAVAVLGLALMVVWVVLPIVAAVKASNGEGYRYAMTIRFVR